MIICHSREFIFVHIHKAGGTSVEKAIDPHLAWNDLILGGSSFGERVQQPYAKRFGLDKHSTIADIERVCGGDYLDRYFVFALVRQPLARICSIYNFVASIVNDWALRHNLTLEEVPQKITAEAAKKVPGLRWTSTRVFLRTAGFSDFIRHEEICKAPGFRAQVDILTRKSDGRLCGQFFRLEDYPEWEAKLGKSLNLDLHLLHANKSGLRLIEPGAVSVDDRLFIEKAYRRDYDAFGYSRQAGASS